MAGLSLLDALGLLGCAAYVAAHYLVQVLHWPPVARTPVLLNILGPALMLVSLAGAFNLASFLSQCFWLALTLLGCWRRRQAGLRAQPPPSHASSRTMTGDPQ